MAMLRNIRTPQVISSAASFPIIQLITSGLRGFPTRPNSRANPLDAVAFADHLPRSPNEGGGKGCLLDGVFFHSIHPWQLVAVKYLLTELRGIVHVAFPLRIITQSSIPTDGFMEETQATIHVLPVLVSVTSWPRRIGYCPLIPAGKTAPLTVTPSAIPASWARIFFVSALTPSRMYFGTRLISALRSASIARASSSVCIPCSTVNNAPSLYPFWKSSSSMYSHRTHASNRRRWLISDALRCVSSSVAPPDSRSCSFIGYSSVPAVFGLIPPSGVSSQPIASTATSKQLEIAIRILTSVFSRTPSTDSILFIVESETLAQEASSFTDHPINALQSLVCTPVKITSFISMPISIALLSIISISNVDFAHKRTKMVLMLPVMEGKKKAQRSSHLRAASLTTSPKQQERENGYQRYYLQQQSVATHY